MTTTDAPSWLDSYGPAEYDCSLRSVRPVLTVEEASERQEAVRLAYLQAEEAFKAARATWRQAGRDYDEARRSEAAKIPGEVDLFGVPS